MGAVRFASTQPRYGPPPRQDAPCERIVGDALSDIFTIASNSDVAEGALAAMNESRFMSEGVAGRQLHAAHVRPVLSQSSSELASPAGTVLPLLSVSTHVLGCQILSVRPFTGYKPSQAAADTYRGEVV